MASSTEAMDLRKCRRAISKRESARRSRRRKQKHIENLEAQVSQLEAQNKQLLADLNAALMGDKVLEEGQSATDNCRLNDRVIAKERDVHGDAQLVAREKESGSEGADERNSEP